jgi:MFS family permease
MKHQPFEAADIAEWRRGWPIALGVAIGLGTGIALYVTVGSLFTNRIIAEFGWSRGDLSLASAVGFLAGAVSLSFVGRILDRVGYRRVLYACVPALAFVYVGFALVSGSYALYLALMILGGVFGAGTGAITYTRPVIASFDRQRGFALGVSASGTSLAAMTVPPILTFIIATYGWRSGLIALMMITLCVGMPLALWLIGRARDANEDDRLAATRDEVPTPLDESLLSLDVTLRQSLRGGRFWMLTLALVAVNIPGSGVVGQLAPMITDKGFSETQSGLVMSIYAIGLLAGRLSTGFALDRVSPGLVAAVMTGLPALGAMMLLIPEPSFALAAFAVGLIGLQQGSEIDLLAYFISRSFGLKSYSSIFGAIATAGALATATGLVLFGEVHDATGSYDIALVIGSCTFVIGALAFFVSPRLSVR